LNRGPERLASTEWAAWLLFGAAAAVAVGLMLWFGRERTFSADELTWFMQSPDLDVEGAFEPHNGHLLLPTRLVYLALFETSGTDYLPFQLLTVAMMVLTAGLLFAYLRRRVGALVALAPTVILLVFGSASAHLLRGNGFTVLAAVACGLGALIALDRGDRKGDILACALLCLGVVTYTSALAFAAGVAVSVLLRDDRWRRIWIVVVPITIYAAWWLWALGSATSSENRISPDNVFEFPSWAFDSLGAVLGALTGLDYIFSEAVARPVLAWLAIIALGWRLWRGSIPKMLWAAFAIVATMWMMGAITQQLFTLPDNQRYLYPGAVAVLLVAAWAADGARWRRPATVVLILVTVAGVVANIIRLRDAGSAGRAETMQARAELTGIELAGDAADPAYVPIGATFPIAFSIGPERPASTYLAATNRYGTIGYSPEEVRGLGETSKALVDERLAEALSLSLRPAQSALPSRDCGQVRSLDLTAGQTARLESDRAATVYVRRFAERSAVEVGRLVRGEATTLAAPADEISQPWRVTTSGPIGACAAQ
jgi:hypothetical protein